ncbi:lamin tail domain-containing protein, partial [Candidatus Bipolaricaulota bacterium]
SYAWSDGDAGGQFIPDANQASPSYQTPHDPGCEGSSIVLTLEVEDQCGLTDQDAMTIELLNVDVPGIEISKTIVPPHDTTPPGIGEIVEYVIEVSNTGNIELTNVELEDLSLGWSAQISTLPAGGTSVYAASGALPESAMYGPFTNTVTAVAQSPCGLVSAEASRTVPWQNSPPNAEDAVLETCVNTPIAFNLVAYDANIDSEADPLNPFFHHMVFPAAGLNVGQGAVTANMSNIQYGPGSYASVAVQYTPPLDFIGTDIVTFTVVDPYGEFAIGTITISVVECGEEPTGGGGALTTSLVVNEVAWAGTDADREHEWIELYNGSSNSMDLDGWTIRWRRKQPETPKDWEWKSVDLHGVIPPFDYFLLERYVDEAVSDIEADLVYGHQALPEELRLSDLGEIIELLDPQQNQIDSVNKDHPERDGWPAGCLMTGEPIPYSTLERIDPIIGDIDENWAMNYGLIINGEDSQSRLLTATARMINEETVLRVMLEKAPLDVVRGDILTISSALPSWAHDIDEVPQIHFIRIDRSVLQCIAKLVLFEEGTIEIVALDTSEQFCTTVVNTESLLPGEYQIWITLGKGTFHNVSMLVAEREE